MPWVAFRPAGLSQVSATRRACSAAVSEAAESSGCAAADAGAAAGAGTSDGAGTGAEAAEDSAGATATVSKFASPPTAVSGAPRLHAASCRRDTASRTRCNFLEVPARGGRSGTACLGRGERDLESSLGRLPLEADRRRLGTGSRRRGASRLSDRRAWCHGAVRSRSSLTGSRGGTDLHVATMSVVVLPGAFVGPTAGGVRAVDPPD